MTYSLEKHKTGKHKHICPHCGKRTFVRYINNETSVYLHDTVGRCDRQDSCAYHYPPRGYFKDNKNIYNNTHNNNIYYDRRLSTRTLVPKQTCTNGTNHKIEIIDYIPFKYIEQTARTRHNNLIAYFFTLFDWQTICDATDKYFVGCTKDKAVIYPQIDAQGKVRTAKIQQYNPMTGKRTKDQPNSIGWVHRKLMNKGLVSKDFKLAMCLFGEHLVRSARYKDMPVGIVESEKTALIAAACMPHLVWMASGALDWLNVDKLRAIKDRKIILYPDASTNGRAFDKWTKTANRAKERGYAISVSALLEQHCTDEQKEKGYDLGDYMIDKLLMVEQASALPIQSTVLSAMISRNPILAMLVERFDAVAV